MINSLTWCVSDSCLSTFKIIILPTYSCALCTPDGHIPNCFTRCQHKPSCLLSVLQDTVCRCLIDITAGMDYLHSLGVLHGAQYSLICES